MKKIAFMFVAAALFAACGEKKAPVQEAEVAEVEEAFVLDSQAVYALIGDTTGMNADTLAAKFNAIADSLKAAAEAPAEEVVAEEAPAETAE